MKFIKSAFFVFAISALVSFSAIAQENEPVVIDEVVAQVNDGVITLSRVNAEANEVIDAMVKSGKTKEAARAEVDSKRGELIANLINEELILQKGKDMNIDSDIEAEINRRLVELMKESKLKTLEALYAEMQKAGVKPDELRANWRAQLTRDSVLGREVFQKIVWSLSDKELKAYYEANKGKFLKPEKVKLSEIFLSYAGRDEAAVNTKADELIRLAKTGVDFGKLAVENSERPDIQSTKGSVGTFTVTELTETIANAIKGTKTGDIVKFKIDEGVEIIKVDERIAGSSESVFDEFEVRRAIAGERYPTEQKKYLAELRRDAYVKIAEGYKALVAPFLVDPETTSEAKKAGN